MLRTARFVPLVLTAWVVPAAAADCLQQIDSITVEFDLPASQSMAEKPGDAYYVPPPPNPIDAPPPPPTMAPPGRPGALRGAIGGGSLGTAPVLAHDRLNAAQREKLVSILRQARGVEALGNEPKCFELLREAQVITKDNG
jgi:hypothetical protein